MTTETLKQWFMSQVAGKSASDYKSVLKNLTPLLNEKGIGQQHDSNGVPRGRLFLPTEKCLNTAPKTANDKLLGVNQNPDCWEHIVDVVDNGQWVWIDRGGPEYIPFESTNTPVPQSNMVPWVPYDEQGFQALKKELAYDYARRPQGADFDVSVWSARTFHNAFMGPDKTPLGMTAGVDRAKHEWCTALGVPFQYAPTNWDIGDPV